MQPILGTNPKRLTSRKLGTALALLLLAMAAAGQTQRGQSKDNKQAEPAKTPAASDAAKGIAAPVDPKSYVIGPEDVIGVNVWREPNMSGAVPVRPDGKITLPLIGDVQAGGLTPEQLTKALTEKIATLLNSPEITVSVIEVRSKKYFVTGEVQRPSDYPLVVPTTVLQAIVQAGGFREFANKKDITILRDGKILRFNYNDVSKGKHMEQNILLQNGDYVIVK